VFNDLKHHFFLTPVLYLSDMKNPFSIEINASDCVVGVFLTQHGHPMAHHSDTLSYVLCNYPTYEK
jgi:hypothetical protein